MLPSLAAHKCEIQPIKQASVESGLARRVAATHISDLKSRDGRR